MYRLPAWGLKFFAVVLVIVCIEFLSWMTLFFIGMHDASFAKIYDPVNNIARYRGACENYLDTLEINPYLGFTHNQKCSNDYYRVNNIGLLNQDVDASLIRKKYAIGIFGGSVASQFAGLNSISQLESLLNACYTNKAEKLFAVYNFADGAWKQPQQVIAFSLYQDFLDAAISVEGFNESYLIGWGVDMIYPPKNFYVLKEGVGFAAYSYRQIGAIQDTPLRFSSSIKALVLGFRLMATRLENMRIQQEEVKYSKVVVDPNQHNDRRIRGFVRSFEGLGKAHDKYTLVVVQPTPLGKVLTSREKMVVGKLDYGEKYQRVRHAIKSGAVNTLDLSDLFVNSNEEIFGDPIHFIKINGYKSLGDYYVALEIAKKLENDKVVFPRASLKNCLDSQRPDTLK